MENVLSVSKCRNHNLQLTFISMTRLIGDLNRCLEQEKANRDESLRIPGKLADPGKLVIVLQTKCYVVYYEKVVTNTLQKSAMRHSGN